MPLPEAQVPPVHLYKYRSISASTKSVIVDQRLYFAHADTFNDPFDCLPRLSLDSTATEFKQYLDGLYRTRMPELGRAARRHNVGAILRDPTRNHRSQAAADIFKGAITKVRNTTGILSLSNKPDHMLLWGHYADSHKGISLRFRSSVGDEFFEYAMPIVYQVERPTINIIRDSAWAIHERALLTKADYWAYEDEWRVMRKEWPPGLYRFPRSSLDGIILGAKITKEHEAEVRSWASGFGEGIEWLRARIDEHDFRLNIEPA